MKKTALLLSAVLITLVSFAQRGNLEYSGFFDSYYYKGKHNLNFTGSIGAAFYRGDLCETCFSPGLGFGIGANYKLWPRVMFGAEFHYVQLNGKDEDYRRNISFNTNVLDFTAYGRFYLADDIIRVAADRGRKPKFLKTYVMAGIGLANYNATSKFTQPAPPTDTTFYYSEGVAYPQSALIIPVGLGFSWRISNRFSIITEASYRFSFTDYLDDVSKRGNPDKNDGYGMVDFKLQYTPFAPRKRKKKSLAPPDKYEGPKGTETWKNKKKEEPVKQNNYNEEYNLEEQPAEETPSEGEEGWPEENQEEQQQEEQQEETPSDDGWGQ